MARSKTSNFVNNEIKTIEEDEHFHVTAEMLDEATHKWCFIFDIENSIVTLIIFHVLMGSF